MTPTAEQIIERLKRSFEAFNRGNFDDALEWAHPDIVVARLGDQAEIRGVAALRSWFEPDAFESQTYELLDYEVEENRIMIRLRTKARGAGSGIEMEVDSISVWTFDDEGRAVRIEPFLVQEEEAARRAFRGN